MPTFGRDTTITWLGHGTFLITTPEGKRLLIDPWLDTGGNPSCPKGTEEQLVKDGLDAILITHGHGDHIGSLIGLAKQVDAQIVCQFDLAPWLTGKGIDQQRIVGMNKGGTIEVAGVRATMTHAVHSSTFEENGTIVPMGSEAGYVLQMANGFTIYHTGDTAVTMDMQIIGDLYAPDVAILPIGDHFTMGPRQAAYALKLIGAAYAIPEHYATFPLLTGTPDQLREHLKEFKVKAEVLTLEPGQSID